MMHRSNPARTASALASGQVGALRAAFAAPHAAAVAAIVIITVPTSAEYGIA